MLLEALWHDTWNEAELTPPEWAFADLLCRYSEPHRHYHTSQHLQECFEQFERLRGYCPQPLPVLLAIWYHDAIYNSRASDNEGRSAELADDVLAVAGASPALRADVRRLIEVTRHSAVPQGEDEIVLVDVDLAILGAPFARFWEYEEQVRSEYAWVDDNRWREGRGAVLRGFLKRPFIYGTAAFRSSLEAVARDNLEASLARLAG